MSVKTDSYDEHLYEDLKDPEIAAAYLTECFSDDRKVFLMALHDIAKAYGISDLPEKFGIDNLKIKTLDSVLKTIGLKISFQPI